MCFIMSDALNYLMPFVCKELWNICFERCYINKSLSTVVNIYSHLSFKCSGVENSGIVVEYKYKVAWKVLQTCT